MTKYKVTYWVNGDKFVAWVLANSIEDVYEEAKEWGYETFTPIVTSIEEWDKTKAFVISHRKVW